MVIVDFNRDLHSEGVSSLWKRVFAYKEARNSPGLSIEKKVAVGDGLFFVAIDEETLRGTVMAGYDGHRGWIYSLAVDPDHRRQGIGSALLDHAERRLSELGCVKINLQVLDGNLPAQRFYEAHGFAVEHRVSMGKEVAANVASG